MLPVGGKLIFRKTPKKRFVNDLLMISYCKLMILPKKLEMPKIENFVTEYLLMISYCKLKVLVREYFLMISFENTRIKENLFLYYSLILHRIMVEWIFLDTI